MKKRLIIKTILFAALLSLLLPCTLVGASAQAHLELETLGENSLATYPLTVDTNITVIIPETPPETDDPYFSVPDIEIEPDFTFDPWYSEVPSIPPDEEPLIPTTRPASTTRSPSVTPQPPAPESSGAPSREIGMIAFGIVGSVIVLIAVTIISKRKS